MKKELREQVWNKYDKKCAYCGSVIEYKDMQVDHLTPQCLSHFYTGINSFENLMPSCRRCNHYKNSYILEDFRELLKTLHERVEKNYINKVAIDYEIVRIFPFDGNFYFERINPRFGNKQIKKG